MNLPDNKIQTDHYTMFSNKFSWLSHEKWHLVIIFAKGVGLVIGLLRNKDFKSEVY